MGVNIFMTTYAAQMCKGMLLVPLFRRPLLSTFCVSGMLGTQPYSQGADSLVYIYLNFCTLGCTCLKLYIMIFQRRRPLLFLLVSLLK